jgi:flagellar hook protein FlgE
VDVTIHYTSLGNGQWEWNAVTDGANQVGGTPGTPVVIANGTLTFNSDGQLDAVGAGLNDFQPVGATAPQPLTFDFGSALNTGGDGSGVTQFANTSATSFIGQDGFGAGDLAAISIGTDGVITGSFTNGQTRALGQVGLADFPAPDQLERIGDNLFAQSNLSGEPNIGAPTTGGRGKLFGGALEQSNVDVATELVRMIVVQRNFQANSKTVSTADQMLAELIQIKR